MRIRGLSLKGGPPMQGQHAKAYGDARPTKRQGRIVGTPLLYTDERLLHLIYKAYMIGAGRAEFAADNHWEEGHEHDTA